MNSSPFFSVLVPSYNRPELIGAAVGSVLANNWPDCEIIISDNNSPRQSEIVAALQPYMADSRVRLHLQPVNLLEAGNRDFLFESARGEWQIVLCDDDMLYPNALTTLHRAIHEQSAADLFVFGYTVIDEHDQPSHSRSAPRALLISAADRRLTEEAIVADALPFWLYHPATFCSRRSVHDRIKPNRAVGIGDDVMFLIDYINAGGAVQVVPAVLMYYRKMSAGQTTLQMNQSAGDLPNLVTRALILRHLAERNDLQPQLADFVSKRKFRQRLLYDPVLWSGVPPTDLLTKVPLPEPWAEELRIFATTNSRQFHRLKMILRRFAFFSSIFGWVGIFATLTVIMQRLRARAN